MKRLAVVWVAITCAAVGCAGPRAARPEAAPSSAPDPGGMRARAAADGGARQLVWGPYKHTSIDLDSSANLISTSVSGSRVALASELAQNGGRLITLAFATGECGSENWGGVPGAALASANVAALNQAGIRYIVSTGGAAGAFSCGSDAGMKTFIERWLSPGLVGIDLDIEAGQSDAAIAALIARVQAAHSAYPSLYFSLTLATGAGSEPGAELARSRGTSAPSGFNRHGEAALAAVKSTLGFRGDEASWPSYLTVNLMTMDYGSVNSDACVVKGGLCQMGESAIQAAHNLHDHWGVPYANIELTPMIGGNDVSSELFTLEDVDTIAAFARTMSLAGVHYWSYDRDRDCPAGPASSTCNSYGKAGTRGFWQRFAAAFARAAQSDSRSNVK